MYSNLIDNLQKKGISINAAAALMNMSESTFRTKVYERDFKFGEALKIRDNLFPELDLIYLFKKTESPTETA